MNFNNLHALAATVIPQQPMSWIRFKENSENAMGVTVPVYYPAETIEGSLQPMDAQDVAKPLHILNFTIIDYQIMTLKFYLPCVPNTQKILKLIKFF